MTTAPPPRPERGDERAAKQPLTWEQAPRNGAVLHLRAVPMNRGALTSWIVLVGLIGLAGGLAVLIFVPFAQRLMPRAFMAVFALIVVLPLFWAVRGVIAVFAQRCTIAFNARNVRLTVGTEVSQCGYAEIDELLWRRRSTYARIELRIRGRERRSIIVGVARQGRGVKPELPDLSHRIRALLDDAGLVELTRARWRSPVIRYGKQDPA